MVFIYIYIYSYLNWQEDRQGEGQGQDGGEGQDEPGGEGQGVRLVRSTKDRLAIVVTGLELEGEHLLCIPGLEGGTAAQQVDALYAALVQ